MAKLWTSHLRNVPSSLWRMPPTSAIHMKVAYQLRRAETETEIETGSKGENPVKTQQPDKGSDQESQTVTDDGEESEGVRDDEDDCSVHGSESETYDDYLDFEFEPNRCRDQGRARHKASSQSGVGHTTNKTERKRTSAIEARIQKQANAEKRLREKGVKRLEDSRLPQANKDRQQHNKKTSKCCQPNQRNVIPSELISLPPRKQIEVIPTQHVVNGKNLASGVNNKLLELQDRDITPEDYELLLTLDDLIARPTVHHSTIQRLPTSTVEGDNSEVCSVCMEQYSSGQQVKTLPCCHTFHSHCIDQWLTTMSNRCPLDGQQIIY